MKLRPTYLTVSAVLALAMAAVMAASISMAAQHAQQGGQDRGGGQERQSSPGGGPGQEQQQQRGRGRGQIGSEERSAAQSPQRVEQSPRQQADNPPVRQTASHAQDRFSRRQPARPASEGAQSTSSPSPRTAALPSPSRPAARPADVKALRRNVQVQHQYRAGVYQMPRGYSQRRWSYGQRLPASYFARNYWINDYLLYALFSPPSGLVWVRVGHDALLIDRYDGEIIQVRYNVFY